MAVKEGIAVVDWSLGVEVEESWGAVIVAINSLVAVGVG